MIGLGSEAVGGRMRASHIDWWTVAPNIGVAVGTFALAVVAWLQNRSLSTERSQAATRAAKDAERSDLRWRQQQLMALLEALQGELVNVPDAEPRIVALLAALPRRMAVVARRRFDPDDHSDSAKLATVDARIQATHHLLHPDRRAPNYAVGDAKRRGWQERADVMQELIDTAAAIERLA